MIKTKTKIKTIIIFLLVLMPFVMSFLSANAQTTYNWIQNSGFEDGSGLELISNNDLESGFTDGWTSVSYITTDTTKSHSPTTSFKSVSGGASVFWYNFTTPIPVGNVQNFTYWYYPSNTGAVAGWDVLIYYTDGTFDTSSTGYSATVYNTWIQKCVLNNVTLSQGKEIKAFKMYDSSVGTICYFDDFSLTSVEIGQTTIDEDTEPWYTADGGNGIYGYISDDISHSGNKSFGATYTQLAVVNIIQDINYLSTGYVEEFSCWAYLTTNQSRSVYAYVYYHDNTYDYVRKIFAGYAQWSKLDFSDALPDSSSDKVIKKIIIMVSGGALDTREVFIDDVSLLATIPLNQQTFEMSFIPNAPLDTTGTYWLSWNTQYICKCLIFDNLGVNSENGTYYISSSAGFSTSGNFTEGEFQFNMPTRTTYTNEVFSYRIIIYNGTEAIRVFELDVNVQWFSGAFNSPTPSSTAPITPERANLMIDFFTFFLLILALPMMLSVGIGAYTHNGTATVITFFGGLLTTIIIGIVVSYLPWWTILPMVIFLVIVAYGLFSKITSSGGG